MVTTNFSLMEQVHFSLMVNDKPAVINGLRKF